MNNLKINWKKAGSVAIVLALFLIVGSQIPYFLSPSNLLNVVRQSSIISIVAYGSAMVIIIKGIDLSVGGIMSLAAMVNGLLMLMGVPVPLAIAAGLLVGIAMGLFNGLMVQMLEVPAFITTLVIGNIATGLALIFNKGGSLGGFPDSYVFLGNGTFLGIPICDYMTVVFCIVSGIIMYRTRMGVNIFALGGNELVVKQQGISTSKINFFTFAFSGFCAAAAGILLSAQMDTVHPTQGDNYQLDAVAACVIGGINMAGGEGNVCFALLGALVIGLLRNALNLLGLHPFYQNIVIGSIIILIVAVSINKRRVEEERAKVF